MWFFQHLTGPIAAFSLGIAGLAAGAVVRPPQPLAAGEVLRYTWQLEGIVGAIAGLFFPDAGTGSLTTVPEGDGLLRTELLITSEKSREGEFWTYGALIDVREGRTVRAWSAYRFRGEAKYKEEEITGAGVVDLASGIYRLRKDPPTDPRRMRIWSDGKIYPVLVTPGESVVRQRDGERIEGREYTIQGVDVPGERFWSGRLDLVLAEDPESTPVEIAVQRSWTQVRLLLADPAGVGASTASLGGERGG